MLSGPSATSRSAWFRRPVATAFGALIAVAMFAVLFPWFPGSPRLEEGTSSPFTLTAPSDFSYESEIRTEELRDAAAAAISDVKKLDPGIPASQTALLEQQLEEIDTARSSPGLADSARESAIRAVAGTRLSARAAAALADVPDAQWEALADEALNALGRVLSRSIDAEDIESERQAAAGLLSPLLTADQLLALTELLDPLIVPTLVVDEETTEALRQEARETQPAVRLSRIQGEILVRAGEVLTSAEIELLEQAGLDTAGVEPLGVAAAALIAILLGAACGGYLLVAQPRALAGARRLVLFSLLLVLPAASAKFALPLVLPDAERTFLAYAIPLAAAPMAAAVLLEVGSAILIATLLTTVVTYITVTLPFVDSVSDGQLETARMWLSVSFGSLAGLYFAARADRLHRYLVAGLGAAGASAIALSAVWLLDADRHAADLGWIVGATAAGGVMSALIAVGSFVLLSRPFGIITRVELMELAQLSHPLLRRLQDEAPGTFQHSIMVGNMAERAADRIGADPLLVRIGAYYHDIGKLVSPSFFVENVADGENPHEKLDPLQSTRVIQQHVTGGVDIARREGLPDAIVQFIPQHHGTRLAQFFYRRAAETDPDVDPELFRYPGPKPQSKEAALIMLADSCEATVRASPDHTSERIRGIVDATIAERIDEGQFDEADISLRDLRIVADTFTATMTAVYHPRVEYPQPTARELAERRLPPLPAPAVLSRSIGEELDAGSDDWNEDTESLVPQRPRLGSLPTTQERELSEDDT